MQVRPTNHGEFGGHDNITPSGFAAGYRHDAIALVWGC